MRKLEHALAEVQGVLRRARSRTAPTDPARVEPARLVVRLDDADLPGVLGEGAPLSLPNWRELLSSAVTWLGPVPVTFLVGSRARHPFLGELVRFVHRMECDTLLVTDGTGLDQAAAEALVDRGLGAVRLWVGGVSESVHHAVVGSGFADASGALEALRAARQDRGAALDLEVALPWQGPAHTEARALLGWAKERGADGFRVVAPWRAVALPRDPETLDALAAVPPPFHRSHRASFDEIHAMVAAQDGEPGLVRSAAAFRAWRRSCPVGGQRVEVTAHGSVYSCPFKAPIGRVEEDLKATWSAGGAHLSAIAGCGRTCAHIELAPAPVLL